MSDLQPIAGTLIFFDGQCNLCSGTVVFMLRHRSLDSYQFVSIQSATAKRLLLDRGIEPESLQSFVVMKQDSLLIKSEAVFEVVRDLGGVWRLFLLLSFLPKSFCDWLYSVIARNRYRWFGVRDLCLVPNPSLRKRFLD